MKYKILVFLCFLTLTFSVFPKEAKAISFNNLFSNSSSFITKVKEKIEYVLAFTPSQKVRVLEKQATKRLEEAKNEAQKGNDKMVENSVKTYENLKNQQSSLLDKDDNIMMQEVKNQTIKQQEMLKEITIFTPANNQVIENVHNTVVENVKKTIEYKEGTTGGAAFEEKATRVFAPGTGPGEGGVKIEGGPQKWAPGTESKGEGGLKIEGGNQKWAPGTNGAGEGGQKVVE